MELDIKALTGELEHISQQRSEVEERLRSFGRGRGRGRGPGGYPGQDRPDVRPGSLDRHPHQYRPASGGDQEATRPLERMPVRDRLGLPPPPATAHRGEPEADLPPPPKRISSAVVVNGETRGPSLGEISGTKRPRDADDDPAAKKRNRRLFGSLLGTLSKFKDDNEKFSQSRVAQQRAEALQRAEERSAREQEEAKVAQREALKAQRQAEIERKIELTIAADVKRLEIALARRVLHSGKLSAFLKTRSGPPVLWLPAQQTATTAPLFQRRLADLDAWKDRQMEDLQKAKQRLSDRQRMQIEQTHHKFTGRFNSNAAASNAEQADEANGNAMEEDHREDQSAEPEEDQSAMQTEELAPVHNASDEAAIDAAGRYDGGDAEDEDMRAAESG